MNTGKKFPAEVLEKAEITKLLNSFKLTQLGIRNRALIAIYLYAQLRSNEALDLRPPDISWQNRTITVMHGKGGKRRVTGIPNLILETYIKPWANLRPESTYFFCSLKGTRLKSSYVRRLVKQQAKKAGISRRVHVHAFRHTGAFNLSKAGANLHSIQKQLGHSTLAVTERYIAHLGADEAAEQISQVVW